MPDSKTLKTELAQLANQARTLYADLEAKGDKATADERQTLENLIQAGQTKRAALELAEKMEGLSAYTQAGEVQTTETAKSDTPAVSTKSWGQVVAESKQRQAAVAAGRPEAMDRVTVPGSLKLGLYSTTAGINVGVLTPPMRTPEIIEIDRMRPFSVIDLVNTQPTSEGSIEYVQLTSRTDNTAVVPEFTAGNFGQKPQSDLNFDLLTATVKTVATWIAASRQVLSDAPRLRAMIDTELMYMVRVNLENQILNGDGVGSNFLGILNWAGIQARVQSASSPSGRGQVTTDNMADTIRRAITDLRLSFYEPDGVVLNPSDSENLELLKDANDRYLSVYDPVAQRIWRVRIVDTAAEPAGTGLVGNFQLGAVLWDREQAQVYTGTVNDQFIRNAITILAELRAAFAVVRPLAFEKITFG